MLVNSLRYRTLEEHTGVERREGLCATTLGDKMGDRDALLARFSRLAGKILLQRALDQQRFGMLALYLVRIVRVHGPQRLAQQIAQMRHAVGGQIFRLSNHVGGQWTEAVHLGLRWQQRMHLVNRIIRILRFGGGHGGYSGGAFGGEVLRKKTHNIDREPTYGR